MHEAVRVRIEAIRTSVQKERARISHLNARLGDDLKRMLQAATSLLDDVDHFFLACEVLREERNAAEWRYWLGQAENVLKRAIERSHVQRLARKLGVDARVI
jgi:hypothetical protein